MTAPEEHVPEGHVPLRYYSAALDEIYRLRAALASEAGRGEQDLALKTFPRSRRHLTLQAVDRMRAAARGRAAEVYSAHDGFDSKAALASAGADECLTRWAWEREVDDRSAAAATETGAWP